MSGALDFNRCPKRGNRLIGQTLTKTSLTQSASPRNPKGVRLGGTSQQMGIGDRVTIEAGDFFKTVPVGADAYLLPQILHEWSEDQCRAILENVRQAMKPTNRLLIIEMVLPEDDSSHPGKMLDLLMLVAIGGQERTQSEYRQLLDSAGFALTRGVPTGSAVSVVEAVLT